MNLSYGKGSEAKPADKLEPLDALTSDRLEQALAGLDERSEEFRARREHLRFSEQMRAWSKTCTAMEVHLRRLGDLLNRTHHVSLDMGIDGTGPTELVWIKEMSGAVPPLHFRLNGQSVTASTEVRLLGSADIDSLDTAWANQMVVDWLVVHADEAEILVA